MKLTSFRRGIFRAASLSFVLLGVESLGATNIKMGIFLSMTGGTASFGEETYNGMKLALDEINQAAKAAGDKGVGVTSILEDEKSDVSGSANAVKKLIDVDKVNVIVGTVASSNTNAAAPIAQAARVPLVTPSSIAANVTQKGDYISRICVIDFVQGSAMARFAYESLGKRSAAIVTDSASDYSIGLAQAFKETFTKLGGRIIVETSYAQNDQDFSSQITKIRIRKPDAVFAPGYYNQVGIMIRQARTLGVRAPFLGGDGWSSGKLFELGGDAIVGNYYAGHFSDEDPDPTVQNFVKKFRARYNKPPSDLAALGYDSIYFVVDAVRRSGGKLDGPTLRDSINATKGFKGVTGTISLDAHRNALKPIVILETEKTRPMFKMRVNP